jgi:transcription elongation factor Elf1
VVPATCFAAEVLQHDAGTQAVEAQKSHQLPKAFSACPVPGAMLPPVCGGWLQRPVEARNSVGGLVCSGIELTMAHFLLIPKDVQCPPAGFSLLEKFTCPNCGREVFIASTTHAEECRTEQIVKARNAVTLNCPVHGVPACVEVPARG